MPEAKKPAIDLKKISNPQLVEALAALHKENTPQNQGKVLDLVLNHASFLAPVVLAPVPKGQNVPPQLQGKTAIQFQLITTKDGRPFFPAFTDWDELRKFSKLQDQRVVMLRFDNYAEMVLKDNRTAGMVVNPLGMSLTLDRKTLESLAKRKAELARGYAQEQVEKDTQVMVGDPEEEPEELLDAVSDLAAKREDIQRLWLREMVRQDGMKRYIIVVDHTGVQEEVFQAIAQAAAPHFGKLPVDMIPFGTGFADAATEDADSGSLLEKMDFTTGLADAKNITFDIDYGAVTVVVDSGAAEPTLSCTNLRQDWFTFTNTGDNTSPVRVSYKVPANYNLGKELGPEPEFVLSVPDANTFHFKRLSITAAMGDAEFDNSNTIAADSIDLDLAMGNFTGSTVQAEQFTANISMGDFDLGLLAGVETAKVEAAMGDIGLTVDGRPDDYALDLQTSMGNVVFNGRTMSSIYTQTAAAPRSVTLTASMGDVVLTTTQ